MRVCLAGNDHSWRVVQSRKNQGLNLREMVDQLRAGHPYRLVSYVDARTLSDPGIQLSALVDNPRDLVMDSGLYSFMFGARKNEIPTTYEAYRDYTRRYLDDMAKWGVDCFVVEADTHYLLGMDATLRLREEFAPLGSRAIYVWHRPEGFDGLVKLAQERDYISFGIPELRMLASGGKSVAGSSKMAARMCNDLLKRVHDACAGHPPRVHLLGCTVEVMMETQLAWSCDSTTWLESIRYGKGRIWTVNGIENAAIRSEKFLRFRKLAMDAFPKAVDFANAQANPDYYLAGLACAYAYSLYQKWLDARYSPTPMRGDQLPEGPYGGRETEVGGDRKGRRSRRGRTQSVESQRSE